MSGGDKKNITVIEGLSELECLRARVTDLLRFNNEFEERARRAERRVKELEEKLTAR